MEKQAQPRTCLDDKILGFMRQPKGVVRKTAVRKYRVARLLQRQKLNFRHVHFLRNFCAISGGRRAVIRLLQGTHCVRTTDVRVQDANHSFVLTKATRLPRDHRAMTLRFIALLFDISLAAAVHLCATSNFWGSCGSLTVL